MGNLKKFSILTIMVLSLVFLVSSVIAASLPVVIEEVEVNGDLLEDTIANSFGQSFDKDDEIEVKVRFEVDAAATQIYENVQVEATIRGYDQDEIIGDITDAFDIKPGVTYSKKLNLDLPVKLDQGTYKLRISIVDADSDEIYNTYELEVEAESHAILIRDVVFNPDEVVEAGRALLTTVRIKNVGNEDENDGVKITVSIPALGLKSTDWIDELDEEESITSEELYMRIPQCTTPGDYAVNIEVEYQDGDETEKTTEYIEVTGNELCAVNNVVETTSTTEPVISAGVDVQNVVAGAGGAIYPITVTNTDSVAKTFTIIADVEDWATVRVSPSNVLIVEPGHTETAYIYLTANENAISGQNLFAVTVKAGQGAVEQFTLIANIVPNDDVGNDGSWDSVRKTLEIGLVVLVIILVILGLIIGLKKMKNNDDEEGDEAQTYY